MKVNSEDYIRLERAYHTILSLEQKLETSKLGASAEPVAVIGMACKFPGMIDNPLDYFRMLSQGKDVVGDIPDERWNFNEYDSELKSKIYCRKGGFISEPYHFDPLHFNISPMEAEFMDPQQRLFLENCWGAIEDAGYTPERLDNVRCGVYAGVVSNDYYTYLDSIPHKPEPYEVIGNYSSMLSARIAYFLNLKGPAITLDTACSSSLVAIHTACKAIQNGDSDMALAGGVTLYVTPRPYLLMCESMMLSKSGSGFAFDERADGFIPGEGCGVVLLKALSKAVRDGDQIYGVIRGTGINQDGKSNGITAPNALAQTELQLDVLKRFGLNPEQITYVEAHGTGTELGDPIELEALTNAFSKFTNKKQYCAIGSVKNNMGHLQAAAGVASLIKVLLGMKYECIFPTIHFEKSNPHIDFPKTPFYVNTSLQEWVTAGAQPRMAAINSFGFSGTNAHMIVEEYRQDEKAEPASYSVQPTLFLIPISAQNDQTLHTYVQELRDFVHASEQDVTVHKELCDQIVEMMATHLHVSVNEIDVFTDWDLLGLEPAELQRLLLEINNKLGISFALNDLVNLKNISMLVEQAVQTKELGAPSTFLANVAYTFQTGRIAMKTRQLFISRSTKELIKQCDAFLGGEAVHYPTSLPSEIAACKQAWESGEHSVQWQDLYDNMTLMPKRISAPTYPFTKQEYRLKPETRINSSSLTKINETIRFEHRITNSGRSKNGHQVNQVEIVSGAYILHLMLQTANEVLGEGINCLEQVHFKAPIYNENEKMVCVELRSRIDSQSAECLVLDMDSPHQQAYSIAELYKKPNDETLTEVRLPDSSEAVQMFERDTWYSFVAEQGFTYGDLYRTVEKIEVFKDEAVATIAASPQFADKEGHSFGFDPYLIDGAIQPVIALIKGDFSDQAMLLPHNIESLRLYRPLPRRFTSYMKRTNTIQEALHSWRCYIDLTVLDAENQIILQLKQLVVRVITKTEQALVSGGLKEGSEVTKSEICVATVRMETKERTKSKQLEAIQQYLIQSLADLLKVSASRIELDKSFPNYGLDSFLSLKWMSVLESEFGNLPKTILFEHFDIVKLSHFLQDHCPDKFAPVDDSSLEDPCEIESQSVILETEQNRQQQAMLISEQDLPMYPDEKNYIDNIIACYGMEGLAIARKDIAPQIFVGANRKSFFYVAERNGIVLAFLYHGQEAGLSELAHELTEYVNRSGKQVVFLLEQRLEAIKDRPIGAVEIGVLQRLERLPLDLKGKKYRHLRYAISNFEKSGDCRVEEYQMHSDFEIDRRIVSIIDAWSSTKQMVNPYINKVREQITTRSFPSMYRCFLTYLNHELVNIVIITPVPSRGGYLMDLEFYPATMPLGGLEYAILHIYKQLLKEGATFLSLGATFGVASAPEANSDSLWEEGLSELWEQGIFNGSGNYQFKNKFRTENCPLYLQRFTDTAPPSILDIIMFIANPVGVSESIQAIDDEVLARYDYNTLFVPHDKVAYDLLTDSWSELPWTSNQAVKNQTQVKSCTEAELIQRLRDYFPFPYVLPVSSGREAEGLLFGALPKTKPMIAQNIMFPTTVHHQVENGFHPIEIPVTPISALEGAADRAHLDLGRLQELLHAGNTAYVAVEIENNAAGGAAVTLEHLKEIRSLCDKTHTSLILDATRVLENALMATKQGLTPTSDWAPALEAAQQMLKLADYVVASLTKDYGSPIGGIVAVRDEETFEKMAQRAAAENHSLTEAERIMLHRALSDTNKVVDQAAKRVELVQKLGMQLKSILPIVFPIGGHCLLIDVKQIKGLAEVNYPAQAFLNWLYLTTGIRGGVHCGGTVPRQANQLVRLAIPVGMSEQEIQDIADRLIRAWVQEKNWRDLEAIHEDSGMYGVAKNRYRLRASAHTEASSKPFEAQRTAEGPAADKEDDAHLVAIIGMSGRYPQADNLEQFWTNLVNGQDAISEIQGDRWKLELFYDVDKKKVGANPCKWGGFLQNVDQFDPQFFQITPVEAEKMDPQQRLFLQTAWHAVEDAGYALSDLLKQTNHNVGVFAGATWSEYSYLADADQGFYPEVNLGSIATRVAYHLGFQGPVMTVDTHCSSSLSAIYLAYESIKNGTCKAAIAGGVNLSLHPNKYQFAKYFLSPTGRCHSFGANGDGYVPGEGVGAILLKPLKDAVAAKDHIYGVIRSVRMRHAGKTAGVHVPNPKSQAELIQETLEQARIHPETLSYVEAHGTGTDLGDPIEIEGLTQAFRQFTDKKQYCAIGSVKSNIGHAEAAAGISQMTKVLLQFKHKKLVPSLHSKALNPNIDFTNTPFYVQQEVSDWLLPKFDSQPRRAAISSFGAGGVNCHCIVEEYTSKALSTSVVNEVNQQRVFPLSAKSKTALAEYVKALLGYIKQAGQDAALTDIAYTLQIGREAFNERIVFIASSHGELADLCSCYLDGGKNAQMVVGSRSSKGRTSDAPVLISGETIERAASLWCEGGAVNWQECKGFEAGRRISLPVYPFAKERYWAPGTTTTAGEAKNMFLTDEAITADPGSSNDSVVYYRRALTPLETPLNRNQQKTNTLVIVFANDPDWVQQLKREGYTPILVSKGKHFERHAPDRFIIDPYVLAHYEAVWSSLFTEDSGANAQVLYLWGNEAKEQEWERYTKELIHPLLPLCTSLNKHALKKPISMVYGYVSDDSETNLFQHALEAFFKTIHLENHHLRFKLVDIDERTSFERNVIEELQDDIENVQVVKYRKQRRYTSYYEEFQADTKLRSEDGVLRTAGVYIVTGGIGGVGYLISQFLASTKQARLVLTGRTPNDANIDNKIAELRRLGASAIYMQTDVSRREEVQSLILAVKQAYGEIHGILHCAGVLRDAYFIQKTPEQFDEVAAVKILGTVYLDEYTSNEPLDLFCLFSSLSSVSGNIGQCDYSFSNSFMDQYAGYRERLRQQNQRYGQSVSLNWPLWEDGGMRIPETKKALLYEQTGLRGLSTEAGIEAFVQAIHSGYNQVLVTVGDREMIKHTLLGGMQKMELEADAEILQSPSNESEEAEAFICDLIKGWIVQCTKLPDYRIDIHTRFEEYGLDSIMIEHLIGELEQYFGKISPTLLFEYQTIAELAQFLAASRPEALRNHFKSSSSVNVGTENVPVVASAAQEIAVADPEEAAGKESEEIAIIGVSGAYPKAGNLEAFWTNLEQGIDCVTEVPQERWDWRDYYDQDPTQASNGKIYCKWGGFLDDVDRFDPLLFQISPKEAETMDPQERLFLQCVWDLMEHNGYTREGLAKKLPRDKGADVGVYVGVTTNSYQLLGHEQWEKGSSIVPTSLPWSIPNRVSYFYNFNGPSIPVDTACSSSLVAIHMACESLRNKECKMAIAGGVNLYFHPSKYLAMCQLGMLSKTGKCHAFGDQADGFVPGEGIGAVLLKPLKQAEEDGDEIWGIIKGTSINHGGRTNGYKVPSPHSQAMLIKKAIEQAQIDPSTINYLEAHGTGTSLGDPIEIEGLTQAYREYSVDHQYCSIGSVKSNIGHAESAAGIASLTKVLLQMKHKKLVPSLHANQLNKHIAFEDTPFKVQTESETWHPVREGQPLRAAISSFGAGGVNAHLILESYAASKEKYKPIESDLSRGEESMKPEHIFIYSARNKERLDALLEQHLDWLCMQPSGEVSLEDLSYTLLCSREEMEERIAFVAFSQESLKESLRSHLNGWSLPIGCAVFAGNKHDRNKQEHPLSDRRRKELIRSLLLNHELKQAAAFWVAGETLDWSVLFEGRKPRKQSLPTYVPARDSYWVTPKEKQPLLCLTADWIACDVPSGESSAVSRSEHHIMLVGTKAQARYWPVFEQHYESSRITKVYLSNRNYCVNPNHFEVDITMGEPDFSIVATPQAVDTIYFMGGMSDEVNSGSMEQTYEQKHNEGALALIGLIKVFHDSCTLKVVTSGSMPVPGYEFCFDNIHASAIAGITKTIPLEFPAVNVMHIDLQFAHNDIRTESETTEELLTAMKETYNADYPYVAYRSGKRYRRALIKAELGKQEAFEPVIKAHGTYLVLGGSGGIGFEISKFLAKRYGARLILVGRSPMNLEKQAQLDLLNRLGAGAAYLEANLRQTDDTLQRIRELSKSYGTIDGVIHSAADVENSLLRNMTPDVYHRVVGIQATSCDLLKQIHLTLGVNNFIVFSSAASFFGSQGGANYCASNTLKDMFAAVFAKQYGVNVRVINWGLWGQVGLGKAFDKVLQQKFRSVVPIEPEEGLRAFQRIASADIIQVMATTASDQFIRSETDYYGPRQNAKTPLRQETHDKLEDQQTTRGQMSMKEQLMQRLKATAAACLKLDPSYIHDRVHLGDYGMDSIVGVAILEELKKWLPDLPSTLMYEYFTVESLADYLLNEYADEVKRMYAADTSTKHTAAIVQSVKPAPVAAAIEDSSEVEAVEQDIAIIGIAGVYPQAKDLREFWINLLNGADCVTEVPADRWNSDHYANNGSIYCKWGGFVDQPDLFDPLFFQISPKEAKGMDPQERLFLQIAAQTFANAGYSKASLGGRKVGVFVGVTNNTYQLIGVEQWDHASNEDIPNSQPWSIPNRVSFLYNLTGPSAPVDTACSSSLTALHLACDSIRNGDSEMALVGGVNLYLHPYKYSGLCQMKMLSPTGQCRAFNDEANGFVPGEGAGAVLIKPLDKALLDGDYIYGVVKATSVNHGGRTNGYTVPNPHAQAALIEDALKKGNIDPRTITYVEAHGTGTVLGDPIEISGLTNAFKKHTSDKQYCAIGSVKTNVGHLEAASGIIGLTKILLQMKHQTLVPTLYHEPVNSRIRFEETPFYLQKQVEAWRRPTLNVNGEEVMYPRRAGISSFGAGGANAHAIIEEYLPGKYSDGGGERKHIVPLSAKSSEQLQTLAKNLINDLHDKLASGEADVTLERIAYTLQIGRDSMEERLAIVATNMEELTDKLNQYVQGAAAEESGIFQGKTQRHTHANERIILDDTKMEAAAKAWVQGAELQWELSYTKPYPVKLPLPACPFSLNSYWLKPAARKKEQASTGMQPTAMPHPILQKQQPEKGRIRFSGQFTGEEMFISQHQVQGSLVFPGAAFLEMAYKAACISSDVEPLLLSQVTFIQPLIVSNGQVTAELTLERNSKKAGFEIHSASSEHDAVKHVQGEIVYGSSVDISGLYEDVDLQEMMLNAVSFDKEQIYAYYRQLGIDYGTAFQSISRLYVRNNHILGELAPPKEVDQTIELYEMHPALLDGALQCMIAYGLIGHSQGMQLPFYIRELQILQRSKQWKYVYIAPSADKGYAYNICILDERGVPVVSISDFTVRPLLETDQEILAEDDPISKKQTEGTAHHGAQLAADSSLLQFMSDQIKIKIATILEWNMDDIDNDTELGDYGFDSLSFTYLADQLNEDFQTDVSPALFFQYATVRRLAEYLVEAYPLHDAVRQTATADEALNHTAANPLEAWDSRSEIKPEKTTAHAELGPEKKSPGSEPSGRSDFPVAVVGMAGRMPQSKTLEQFWEHLKAGRDLVTEVPMERWDWREYYGDPIQEKNKTKAKWGGFVNDIDKFDARFFKIAAREAELMDPQQRCMLELAWHTIEHAGYSMASLSGSRTGVFVGVAANTDYNDLINREAEETEAYQSTGVAISVLVNRISYMFNWHGPSEPIDTACSSSLVAIHRAVESLRSGECDMALAGGVQLILSPRGAISFSKSGMLSPDGRCKTFDESANGYVRSEGMGLVLLKPLAEAMLNGDQIYGVIRGTAVNHGGKGNSITSPNPNAQAEVIMKAIEKAGIDVDSISYIEAHGTGTQLGDPVEINGLKQAFETLAHVQGKGQLSVGSCGIGSVKTNVGHMETAAGMASLFKVLFSLQHQELPPNVHYRERNPQIQLEGSPFYILDRLQPWTQSSKAIADGSPRRAGISSFGFGGANAHLVIEEYINDREADASIEDTQTEHLIVLSAKDRNRLRVKAEQLADYLESYMSAPPQTHSYEAMKLELLEQMGKILSVSSAEIELHGDLLDMGFDQMSLYQLIRKVEERYEVSLQFKQLFEMKTPVQIINELYRKIGGKASSEPGGLCLASVAYTLQVGRDPMEERACWIVTNMRQLIQELRSYCANNTTRFAGSVSKTGNRIVEALEIKVRKALDSKDYLHLADLWIQGAGIDWERLYDGNKAIRRLALPGYPFHRTPYWFQSSKTIQSESAEGQRITILLDPSDREDFAYMLDLDQVYANFADHVVGEHIVLPGAMYFQIVYAAIEQKGRSIEQEGRSIEQELTQLFWLQPYTYCNNGLGNRLYIGWTDTESGETRVKLSSFGDTGRQDHFQTTIRWREQRPSIVEHSIRSIQQRCKSNVSISKLYARFQANGLCYGPTYQTVVSLSSGGQEAIAELVLNDLPTKAWHCPPSIIDGAFQSLAAAGAWNGESGTYLPFSVKRVCFYKPVPPSCYAYIREKGKNGKLMVFDIQFIHSEDHTVIAEFEDFGLKPYMQFEADIDTSFFIPEWQPCAISEAANTPGQFMPVLVVDSMGKLSDSLADLEDARWLQANLTDYKQLEQALQSIIQDGLESLSIVIHPESDFEAVNGYPAYEGMQNLIQFLLKSYYKLPVRFVYLYGSGDEYIAHRALASFGRTAALENQQFTFCFISYDDLSTVPLQAEVRSNLSQGCVEMKYEGNVRLIRQLREMKIDSHLALTQSKLKQGGTYLFTGGNGGLGVLFATYALAKYQINAVIVARSAVTPDVMTQLEEAAKLGGTVRCYRADVSKEEEIKRCMAQVKDDYGSIEGVFHFAGVLNDSFLFRKTMSEAANVLDPKIRGIHNLDRFTLGEELELFVVFSSITGITGNQGQADYAYANRYMDEFIQLKNQRDRANGMACKSYSINWPLWEHGGMQVKDAVKQKLQSDNGLEVLQERHGLDIFEMVLAAGWEQVLPLRGNKERIKQSLEALQLLQTADANSEPSFLKEASEQLMTAQHESEQSLLVNLQRLFSEILKMDMDELDVTEDLEMYGFDSMMMVEVLSRMEAEYDVVLEPSAINQYKTLQALSRHLSTQLDIAVNNTEKAPQFKPRAIEREAISGMQVARSSADAIDDMEGKIAVIGMACRFPQSDNLEQYWDNLLKGKDLISEVPKNRWNVEHYYDPDRQRKDSTYSKWGGFLSDIDKFDPGYWGIPDEVALVMDPQHRIILELVEELWSRSGYLKEEVRGKSVGVFIGGAESSYLKNNLDKVPSESMKHIVVNTISNMMAARVSDTYDLRGPSLTLDTACSSSLVSINEACSQLLNGSCEMAIAGGVQVLLDPIDHIGMSQAGVLSPSKHAYVFDERAEGIVIGEGAGVVLLKPLKKAVENGDRIQAVILGSAVNNDGHTMGLTTPNIEGQKSVIRQALRNSAISPDSISYYEAHGTGTLLGDPIEIRAASQLYRELTSDVQYCGVGSVKANMGHLLRAAGIGSFIKAVLAVQHGVMPKSIHCEKPHPRFQFKQSPFYPVMESKAWEGINGKRRSAISSFGFGGTNCHMIIENFTGEHFPGYLLQRQPLQPPNFNKKVYWLGKSAVEEQEHFYKRLLAQLQSGDITPEQALQMELQALKGEFV
ncbi:SDR family NAD(P)-dependent oxidoreductase [Paenibacillus bouchesdurhonensis]|uniref:SDR family NAD(P)-dependent oxidoreductase n=1 Tax=Paenibacillus bouchesdurhonensis TaxID=1870990 RepID=UPI000DA6044C|nr:SDR family NAD(P)-dependent oxidoreductase [Paenibacillus bouchesdurhonensis]